MNVNDLSISSHDIAVVGMSCRFPGGANSPEDFYDFLLRGGDGIVPVPADRWQSKAYYDADKERKNRMYVNRGGFIEGIDQFDPLFFGLSPAEASRVDPQHRWLLELTYEALENAGLRARDLRGSDTAVYVGQFMHDYEQLQLDSMAQSLLNSHSATGPSMTLTANRISYVFDFKGASVTLDTACSSSLVALDLACRTLRHGESRLAVAAGVNILLRPEVTMSICKASMLSPDGRCKSFDASANGYVRSEGAGVVVLKTLADARRDGDFVWAVIKATGVNQDGQTLGITVPNGEAQKALLLRSLARAGFSADEIQYAEAHGTGTAVGDPIEVNALGAVLGPRARNRPACVVGSVKSNIGHAEAAAGMAGLIKTVMAMNRGVIPKNLHYHQTNPAIDLQALNLRIAADAVAWPDEPGKTRKALVNSFGFGGTNANVILELPVPSSTGSEGLTESGSGAPHLLPISAKTEAGLKAQARSFAAFLGADPARTQEGTTLRDLCFTAATRREHHAHRFVAVGSTRADLVRALESFAAGETVPNGAQGSVAAEPRGLCFVFSGMGTQWPGMGRRLYETQPVFREELDRCAAEFAQLGAVPVTETLFSAEYASSIHETYLAQPAIFSVQAATAALLRSWGLVPEFVVGHSAGEMAAAYVAGALSLSDAVKVVFHRSRLQQTMEGTGRMLAVGLPAAALPPYLAGREDQVSIAAINSDDALTLAGDATALEAIAAKLEEQGVFARFLKVGVPYHSPAMDRLKAPLVEALAGLHPDRPKCALFSTVTGQLTREGDWGADYWARNVRAPVLFKDAVEAISRAGAGVFVEVAPNAALATSIEKNLATAQRTGSVVATLRRDQDDAVSLASALARLHTSGWTIDWSRLFPAGGHPVRLPNYAWQHASYWCEAEEVKKARLENVRTRGAVSRPVHPLLGGRLHAAAPLWQKPVDLEEYAFLADHAVDGEPVYPAAGYVEMILALARHHLGPSERMLEEVQFHRALFLDRKKPTLLETAYFAGDRTVKISAVDAQTGQWAEFSTASVASAPLPVSAVEADLGVLRAACPHVLDQAAFYEKCRRLGLSYAAGFQPVERVWYGDNTVVADLTLPESLRENAGEYLVHPVLLDGAFQGLFAAVSRGYLPVRIAEVEFFKTPPARACASVTITHRSDTELRGNVILMDEAGGVCVDVRGIELKALQTKTERTPEKGILYEFEWESAPLNAIADRPPAGGTWVIFADRHGVGHRLCAELERRGEATVLITSDLAAGFEPGEGPTVSGRSSAELAAVFDRVSADCRGIVYLWGLDSRCERDAGAEEVLEACRAATVVPLHVSHALEQAEWRHALRVFWVTQGVHSTEAEDGPPNPTQGSLWGFGRVFASEFSGHRVTLLDLPGRETSATISACAEEILHPEFEQEVSLRGEGRFVHRLKAAGEETLRAHAEQPFLVSAHRDYEMVRPGSRAEWTPRLARRQEPANEQIELSVALAGLSGIELDLLADSGEPSGGAAGPRTFGCVGVIQRVGSAVAGLVPGDRVVALARPPLGSCAHARAALALKIAGGINDAAAVSLPAAFLPAYYALDYVGRLGEGERILIHDAGTTRGLAAVQLARYLGAEVFAASPNPSSRETLGALGAAHVFDSSRRDFFESVTARLGKERFDVVLNGLDDRPVKRSLELLKRFGRFVELGPKRIPSDPAVRQLLFSKSIVYGAFDLGAWAEEKPGLCREMLSELGVLLEAGRISPVPLHSFAGFDAGEALAQLGAHSVLTCAALDFAARPARVAPRVQPVVRTDGTYLITGGLGGLGLELLRWLADRGAASIVLVGRSGPSAAAAAVIDSVRSRGVAVTLVSADITKTPEVTRLFRAIDLTLPPLVGVFHAAGVLDDGIITQQTPERFRRVLAPKVLGAWNLHRATQDRALDCFVLFSSIASVVGWAGQSNYAAANGFLDTLAHHRRSLGLPGLSINWGPWGGSGMAAKLDEREKKRMADAGMAALAPERGLEALEVLLRCHVPQAGVFEVDWERMARNEIEPARKTLLKRLLSGVETPGKAAAFVDRFKSATAEVRQELLAEKARSVIADVLGIESGAGIDRDRSVVEYGINSLTAMEVRNRLQAALQVKLPATLVLKYPTVTSMVRCILDLLAAEEPTTSGDPVYWDPKTPDQVARHEVNGPLPAFSPTVRSLMAEEHTAHFNVGMFLEFADAAFDLAALKTALRIMLVHHDGARLQIYPEEGVLRGEIVTLGNDFPWEEHDFSALTYEAGVARMTEVNQRLQRSLSFRRGDPLCRFAYYRLNDTNPHRLLVVFHHYVSDAMSQKIFGQGLLAAYQKVRQRQTVRLPAKSYTLLDWSRRLRDFAHGEAVDQLPYWQERIQKSRSCFIPDEFRSNRARRLDDYVVYNAELPAEDYARIVEFCRDAKHEVADLGTYALVKAFSRLTGSESLWVDLITHARSGVFPDVAIPDLFGQISESGSFLFELEPGASPAEQIRRIREQRLAPPNLGIGLRALWFANQDPEVRKRLATNETPQLLLNFDLTDYETEAQQGDFRFAREDMGDPQAQHLRKTADLVRLAFFVAFRARAGRLTLTIAYFRDRFYDTTIRALAQRVFSGMIKVAASESTARVVLGAEEEPVREPSQAEVSA